MCKGTLAAQTFFGQVWRNLGKNPSHPLIFSCSYTYIFKQLLILRTNFHVTHNNKQLYLQQAA